MNNDRRNWKSNNVFEEKFKKMGLTNEESNISKEKNIREKNYDENKIKFTFEKDGFRDGNGNIRENLITKEAKEIADSFKNDGLSNSQLRAFFNEVKALNNRLGDEENLKKFASIYPLILMIKAKIAYRANKDNKMKNLKNFLDSAVDYIKKENENEKGYKTFKDFVIFFETIVGYADLRN